MLTTKTSGTFEARRRSTCQTTTMNSGEAYELIRLEVMICQAMLDGAIDSQDVVHMLGGLNRRNIPVMCRGRHVANCEEIGEVFRLLTELKHKLISVSSPYSPELVINAIRRFLSNRGIRS